MKHETIFLREDTELVALKTYISEDEGELCMGRRPAVLIMPGGAYYFLSDREGEPIMKEFFAKGFNCFILKYSIHPNAAFPRPLQDASLAMIHIKENAEKYNVDPERVFVCGFSAGGHLAASMGTMWDSEEAKPYPDMPYGLNKPCGMILAYPFVTLEEKYTHAGCAENICEYPTSEENVNKWSPARRVTENTVPAYIWTTAEDDCVHPAHSLIMASAMCEKKIPYELHIFRRGPHGLALANEQTSQGQDRLVYPDIATWIDEAILWAKNC